MSSNLECVGLGVRDHEELGKLVQASLEQAQPLARLPEGRLVRWQDPSGARLVLTVDDDDQVTDLLPSFAGQPGTRLANCYAANGHASSASVVDERGEVVTSMVFAAEQHRLLMALATPLQGEASITALGVDMTTHADADTYSASDASLLDPSAAGSGEAPEEYVRHGWAWPPRMAHESFISHGAVDDPGHAEPHARLAGTVLAADRRTVGLSGQSFVVVRVRTAGFDVDVCLSAAEHEVPETGSVVAGTVFLVADLERLLPTTAPELASVGARPVGSRAKRRRWFGRD